MKVPSIEDLIKSQLADIIKGERRLDELEKSGLTDTHEYKILKKDILYLRSILSNVQSKVREEKFTNLGLND